MTLSLSLSPIYRDSRCAAAAAAEQGTGRPSAYESHAAAGRGPGLWAGGTSESRERRGARQSPATATRQRTRGPPGGLPPAAVAGAGRGARGTGRAGLTGRLAVSQ